MADDASESTKKVVVENKVGRTASEETVERKAINKESVADDPVSNEDASSERSKNVQVEKGRDVDEIYAESVYEALKHSSFINLVREDGARQRILTRVIKRLGQEYKVLPFDGRMHPGGSLVETLITAVRADLSSDRTLCLIIDNFSQDLVPEAQSERFAAWLTQFHEAGHLLILGTAVPIQETVSSRSAIIPQAILARTEILRPDELHLDCEREITELTLSDLADRGVAGFSMSIPVLMALALGVPIGVALLSAGIAGSATAMRKSVAPEPVNNPGPDTSDGSVKKSGLMVRLLKKAAGVNAKNSKGPSSSRRASTLFLSASPENSKSEPLIGKELVQGHKAIKEVEIGEGYEEIQKKIEKLSRYFTSEELYELRRILTEVDENRGFEEINRRADLLLEGLEWSRFLNHLVEYDQRITQEAMLFGFDLGKDNVHRLPLYLVKVGRTPIDFAVSLFRSSDLSDLFADFDTAQDSPEDFLKKKLSDWAVGRELNLREVVRQESNLRSFPLLDDSSPRPIRELYKLLVQFDGEERLAKNLGRLDDFISLKGPLEPRFCEWAYARMETRTFISGLDDKLLRASDIEELGEILKIPQHELKGRTSREQLRAILSKVGVHEPELPREVVSGLEDIRRAHHFFVNQDTASIEARERSEAGEQVFCRQGLERLLKFIVSFLWEGGLRTIFLEVIVNGYHGFKEGSFDASDLVRYGDGQESITDWSVGDWKAEIVRTETPEVLRKATAGVLNHLLDAVSKTCIAQDITVPFLRDESRGELWPSKVFHRTKALNTSLNKLLHDDLGVTEEEKIRLRKNLPKQIAQFLQSIDEGILRIPAPIQFFRWQNDGHGLHYEGYTAQGKRLHFYEVAEPYKLGCSYLYLAATNPSAVDMVCVPVPSGFE